MLRLIPVMADAMAITTVTPMATPRMVSAARTLLARIESRAMAEPSSIRVIALPPRARIILPAARRLGRAERPGWPGRRRRQYPRSRPAALQRRWTREPPRLEVG